MKASRFPPIGCDGTRQADQAGRERRGAGIRRTADVGPNLEKQFALFFTESYIKSRTLTRTRDSTSFNQLSLWTGIRVVINLHPRYTFPACIQIHSVAT